MSKCSEIPASYGDTSSPVSSFHKTCSNRHQSSTKHHLSTSGFLLLLSVVFLAIGGYLLYNYPYVQGFSSARVIAVTQWLKLSVWTTESYGDVKTNQLQPDQCAVESCCWVPAPPTLNKTNITYCFLPNYTDVGYKFDRVFQTTLGVSARYTRAGKSRWPDDVMIVQVDTMEETDSRFHFKIYDPNNRRFEVPIDTPTVTSKAVSPQYAVAIGVDDFSLAVTRTSAYPLTLFDTAGSQLTFADQYIEITTTLPTNYIYGLGEHRDRLLHDVSKGFTMAMWARAMAPAACVNCNLYGQHPFFIGLDDQTGTAYGVFLLNSNAMEVIATPASGSSRATLTYRTIGGILDFYVFTGPKPVDVVHQYLLVIGLPYMPPYWALGYHLCRWGYNNSTHMKAVITRMREGGFPYDTQWNDIEYMDKRLDWTYDHDRYADLPAIVKDLHDHDQHYMIIVDPGISNTTGYPVYDEGLKEGVFILQADKDEPLVGKVWPGYTVFPDFFNPATQKWWLDQARRYHQTIPFDGLWNDMNELANFVTGSVDGCTDNKYDNPPYTPSIVNNSLRAHTICPSARHTCGIHYNLHSLYGHSELVTSQKVLHELRPGKRTLVISRSTFPSSGSYAGHWTGDNAATWTDLQYSIPGFLNFQFFGIPLVGADICGFMGIPGGELCVRWTQLGAFYPFMRNHNSIGNPDQDPAAPMFTDEEKAAMKEAMIMRYIFIPYLYTLLAEAHTKGSMVAKPLWFEYSDDIETYSNDRQFMWGSGIMIIPVLDEGATTVKGYFPKDTWIGLNGSRIESRGEQFLLDAPLDTIPVYYKAGQIIPLQPMGARATTTTEWRKTPFALMVTLDESQHACGSLYWDDGESLDSLASGEYNHVYFIAKPGNLTSTLSCSGYKESMPLTFITLANVKSPISTVTVNGAEAIMDKLNDYVYEVEFDAIDLSKPISVSWN